MKKMALESGIGRVPKKPLRTTELEAGFAATAVHHLSKISNPRSPRILGSLSSTKSFNAAVGILAKNIQLMSEDVRSRLRLGIQNYSHQKAKYTARPVYPGYAFHLEEELAGIKARTSTTSTQRQIEAALSSSVDSITKHRDFVDLVAGDLISYHRPLYVYRHKQLLKALEK